MPVTRPLLSCSPFLSFQSAFRASGQSCAQCPWFLHNLHFVQVEKSCSLLAHSPHFHFLDTLFSSSFALLVVRSCSTTATASLSPPSLSRRCLRCLSCHLFSVSRCSCLFIQRLALLVLVHSASRAARACASCCGCLGGEQSRSGSNFNAFS